ncbi:MAG TPA: tetratricopeptide repeat protein, partial [Candidatus Aminicenantes bacterium]|nr:tetratricopeptide repeat protein [Candidatus Aminicenantes bacterium]
SVAVMYFENNTGDPSLDYLRKGLCYQVIQSLLQSARLRVITTDRMFAILRDKGLLKNETYSTDDLKHVAERAQARYILQGSFAKIGRVYKINSFLLDAETWETAGSTQAEVEDLSQLNAAVERMTPAVKASLHSPGGPAAASSSGGLDRITTRSPEALKNFIEGETLFFEGKFEGSAEAYRNAIGLDGDFALAYRGLAAASLYQSKRAEAKANLEKALALAADGRASPRDRHLIEGLYNAVFKSSFPGEAVHQYQQVLSISPDDEEGLRHLGSLYRNLEEWSKARDCWERLLALDKFNPFLYINLSTIYLAEGLPEKAVDILPEDPALLSPALRRRHLGLIALCQGRYEEALAAVNQALELEPGQSIAFLLRGNIRQLQGDAAAAREDYLRIVRGADTAAQALGLRFLAGLCLQEGRVDEFRSRVAQGIDLSRRAAMQDEEDSFLLMEAAGFQLKDDPAAAEGSVRRAVHLAEELNDVNVRAEGLGLLGRILLAQGDAAGAAETAERLRLLTETSGLRHLRKHYFRLKGAIARQAGDYASAADLGRMAVAGLPFPYSLNDDHAVYYESLALTAEAAGEVDRAIGIRQDIRVLTSGRLLFGDLYARNYYRLGKLFLRKNLRTEAADAFETFLRLWARADSGRPEIADALQMLAALKIPRPRPASKTAPAP